jgi:hypothetical protein
MYNDNMLNLTNAVALIGALAVGFVFAWELRNRRTLPPIRVERAKHPRWYWLCIVIHAVILAFMVLVCLALAVVIFFNHFFD